MIEPNVGGLAERRGEMKNGNVAPTEEKKKISELLAVNSNCLWESLREKKQA